MATEKYHWTSPGGVKITLPHMKAIKSGIIRRHRKEEPVDFLFSLLEEVGDEPTIALVDELSTEDLNALMEDWQSQVSAGE